MKQISGDIKKLIHYSKNGIMSKEIAVTKNSNITLFCMAKGTAMSEHTSIKEGLVYVVEGKGIFKLKGKEIKMLPGVFIFMEKKAVHSLKAEENTSFILSLCSC
jgi:quercetin dioxygenase-like cupin family protein